MDYQIDTSEKSDILRFSLNEGDTILVRPHSIMSKTYSLKEKISNKETLWDKAIENEKFSLKQVSAQDKPGVVTIVPQHPGSITKIEPENEKIFVESSSYLSSNHDCKVDIDKSKFFKKEKLNILEISNIESLFVSGYHGFVTIELDDNKQTIINEEYLIALDESIEFRKINESTDSTHVVKGPGKIYLHARRPNRD